MKLETRIFICFLLMAVLILLTGCRSTKWEWLPDNNEKEPNKHSSPLKPPTPKGITIIKGSF